MIAFEILVNSCGGRMRAATRRAATTSTTHDPSDRSDTHALRRDRRPTLTRNTATSDDERGQHAHTHIRKRSHVHTGHYTRPTHSQPNPGTHTRRTKPPAGPRPMNTRARNSNSRSRARTPTTAALSTLAVAALLCTVARRETASGREALFGAVNHQCNTNVIPKLHQRITMYHRRNTAEPEKTPTDK